MKMSSSIKNVDLNLSDMKLKQIDFQLEQTSTDAIEVYKGFYSFLE